jgi:hypothetical protein
MSDRLSGGGDISKRVIYGSGLLFLLLNFPIIGFPVETWGCPTIENSLITTDPKISLQYYVYIYICKYLDIYTYVYVHIFANA